MSNVAKGKVSSLQMVLVTGKEINLQKSNQ